MKKYFFSFLMMSITAVAIANDPVSKEVEDSFQKEFPTATVVSWSVVGDYLHANFMLDGHLTDAFFSEDGELGGTIRSLFFNDLPLAVSTAIDKRYADADVSEVNEITNANGTLYRLTLVWKGKKMKVRVDPNGNILQAEKIK